mmetsp:Transcript_31493/g.42648  ORF Transcript_31493/g.42648 Transcript_31493/m.42648 type:complete len:107 (-) Transcript_31493:5-325(-)
MPSRTNQSSGGVRNEREEGLVIVRHHAIDWNFHPDYPRSRPNKWRVEMSPDGMSFKEWAFATDTFGQAVYMERWSRHNVQEGASSTMTSPYLAMRRLPREGLGGLR